MTGISVVVLAAGKGTRLEPLTLTHSKAMTPVMGEPIVKLVIDGYLRIGINDFIVVMGPGDPDLVKACDALSAGGLSVKTAVQDERLGTAHALLQARPLIEGDFVLCSCDNIFPDDHLEAIVSRLAEHKPPAVVSLEKPDPSMLGRKAGVRLNGDDIVEIVEKPGENSGPWDAMAKFLFAFDRKVLEYLDRVKPSLRGEMEVQDALRMLMKDSDKPPVGVFADRCMHLTSEKDLIDIHKFYLDQSVGIGIHPKANVHPGASLKSPVVVAEGAVIEEGSSVGPYVYAGAFSRIGKNASVRNAVIYPMAKVSYGKTVEMKVVI